MDARWSQTRARDSCRERIVQGKVFIHISKVHSAMRETSVNICNIFDILVFAMLGMLSPASRGALMTAAIFLFVFMGYVRIS